MDYQQYSPEDLAADAYFQKWIQKPDIETNAFWLGWLEQHPDKQETVLEARKLVLTMRFEENEYSDAFIENIWQNIESRISDKPATRPLQASRDNQFSHIFRGYKKIAAVLLVLLVASALFFILYNSSEKYTTAYGETKTIILPDSSIVTLNANSSLSYGSDWEKQKVREVWLDGEAFFDVRKRSTHKQGIKFIVHTSLMNVEVLGTQFNVNSRRGRARVVLSSGKAKLNSDQAGEQKSIYMQPGEMVELSEEKAAFTKTVVNPTNYTAWKNKQLVFNQTPLSEIALILEDTYGRKVTISDKKLEKMTFTSAIPVDKPEVLLELLAESFKVNITRKEEQVMIGNTK